MGKVGTVHMKPPLKPYLAEPTWVTDLRNLLDPFIDTLYELAEKHARMPDFIAFYVVLTEAVDALEREQASRVLAPIMAKIHEGIRDFRSGSNGFAQFIFVSEAIDQLLPALQALVQREAAGDGLEEEEAVMARAR